MFVFFLLFFCQNKKNYLISVFIKIKSKISISCRICLCFHFSSFSLIVFFFIMNYSHVKEWISLSISFFMHDLHLSLMLLFTKRIFFLWNTKYTQHADRCLFPLFLASLSLILVFVSVDLCQTPVVLLFLYNFFFLKISIDNGGKS